MILIIIKFCEPLLGVSPSIINSLRSYIKHSKECFLLFPNTSKLVKKNSAAPRFSNLLLGVWKSEETLFLVFDLLLQASTALKNAIGHTTVGPELPVSIVPETNPTASLPFYWRQVLAQGHTTSVFILRSNTVVFIPTTQGIFLLDSHLHGNSGAHVAFAEWQHSFDLLSWFKKINNFQYTLGTVTNVKFH